MLEFDVKSPQVQKPVLGTRFFNLENFFIKYEEDKLVVTKFSPLDEMKAYEILDYVNSLTQKKFKGKDVATYLDKVTSFIDGNIIFEVDMLQSGKILEVCNICCRALNSKNCTVLPLMYF